MNESELPMRPRLGLAIMRYFPEGGKQRSFRRIAEELLRRAYPVTLLVNEWQGPEIEGAEIRRLPVSGSSNHKRQTSFSDAVLAARATVDLMVGFDLLAGLDIYYAGDPSFVHRYLHERPIYHRLTPRYRGFRALESRVFGAESQTEILLIAHAEKAKFQAIHGTPNDRFQLLPPGIDRERLDRQLQSAPARDEFMRSLDLDPKDGLILMVGSSFGTKGVDRAIESLAVLPESLGRYFALAVVGVGESRALELRARRLGIAARVRFVGARDDVGHFMKHAEVLVHPARLENTGTAILEAMCCGLPVLVTANCGFAFHVLKAKAGLLAPEPFEQKLFDRLLLEALFSPERENWRRAGLDYARTEDLYGLIQAAADLITERADQNKSRP